MLKFVTPPLYPNGTVAEEIYGTANGCFAIKTTDGMFHLHRADGSYIDSIKALNVCVFNDGSWFAQELPLADSPRTKSFLLSEPIWNHYNADGQLIEQDIDKCEIYANDWYCITKNGKLMLFNANHQLIAENFKQCAVFKNGYALRTNETYYKFADWRIYTPEQTYVNHVSNAAAILGDGFPLVYRLMGKDTPLKGLVYEPESGEVIANNVCNVQTFPNGKFILTFPDKIYGEVSKLYAPSGQRLSTGTTDSVFLPDGRFIQLISKRTSALYRPNGLLHSDEVWGYELAGNYYTLSYESGDTLYNDKGEDIGDGYGLQSWKDNFALFENEQAYHLFNQNGCVLSLDIPE